MMITTQDLILLGIGLVAGCIGGMLGIGGSVIMIPAMTWFFGIAQHLYQGAAMIVNFFVVLPAVYQHHRARAILWPVVKVTIPTAVLGVVAGVWLSSGHWFHGPNERYLAGLFGAFLLYEAANNVKRLFSSRRLPDIDEAAARNLPKWKTGLTVGVPAGLVGGLLGVGGGAVAVPMQQAFLKMPLRRAIANSATTIILVSVFGAVYKNYTNVQAGIPLQDSLRLAAFMVPTGMIGGFIGGRLAHTMPRGLLRLAVTLLMAYFGVDLLRRALDQA
jgi:uncharacterized protein